MPYNLIKEKVEFNEKIANETTQLLIEGDIIVPDVKPDMAVVLKADADVCIDRTDIAADRVSFSGKLTVKVLYLAKGQAGSVHSMSAAHGIDDFINVEGANKDAWLAFDASVANLDLKMLNDRKLSYKIVVDISARVEGRTELELVKTIEDIPDGQLRKNVLSMNRIIDCREDRFIIKDELSLPPGKPGISEILQTAVHIANKDIKLSAGRATVSGDLCVYVLYRSDGEDSVVEFSEHEIPFSGAIDLPLAREEYFCDLSLTPGDEYVRARPNADGEDRTLEVEASVLANITVSCQSDTEVLDDAFIVSKNVCLKREPVSYPRLICKNKNQCPVKEIIELGPECPDMLQIFRVTGKVHTDEIKLIEDKVIAEGVIMTDVLYIAKNDNAPLYNHKAVLPYKQVIETRGAAPGMDVIIEKNIDHAGFNMLSDREVELRFLISFNTKIISRVKAEPVSGVEISDIDKAVIDGMPSIIVYVVQNGDSLWGIAKKYNVCLDDLAEINEIDDGSAPLAPGRKLLILKKVL